MSLEPGTVQGTVRALEAKHLLRTEENFRTQVEKYSHRLCNTPFSDYQFDPAQFAVICVLLLRGPRTPGELKANSGRLHEFADNAEVVETLQSLIDREGGPVVVELPRTPGRRDNEYMHLLSGPVEAAAREVPRQRAPSPAVSPATAATDPGSGSDVAARLAALEDQVAILSSEVADLRRQLAATDSNS